MSVVIRLSRQGKKKHAQYLIVAVDKAKKRDGAYLDRVGSYMPLRKDLKDQLVIDAPLLTSWINKGAVCSQTVAQVLKRAGTKLTTSTGPVTAATK